MSLRQQKKARTRADIIEAAVTLISETGLEAATTREIAARAGISYQTLYNYFPSKNHIVQAILADDVAAWSAAVDACIKQYNGHLLTTLREMNQLGLEQFDGPRQELWREVGAVMMTQAMPQQEFDALTQVGHDRYHALLSIAQGTGELRANIDLHLLAHTILCLCDYALLRHFVTRDADTEQTLSNLQDQLSLLLTPYLTPR